MKFEDDFEEEICDEDKYDALNDETFGNDMSDDWEADHEQYAKIDEETKKRWPDGSEMNGDYTDTITSDSIFSEPLKTLPDLENELRQLSIFSHYYENSPHLQFQNHLNLVHQNLDIHVPNNNCGPIRRPTPIQGYNSNARNVFNPPPGFHETNGHMDDDIIKPPSKIMSSAISVADLERQLIQSVKVNPSIYQQPPPEINNRHMFMPIPQFYKTDQKYNNIIPTKNPLFPKIIPPNLVNCNRNHNGMEQQHFQQRRINDYNIFEEQHDEDAGFMTLREKHWLAGIQTIQFNNSNPLEDDYYFTMYQKRHHCSSGIKSSSNSQQSDVQSKINNVYTPLHFENSLGKVQVGSVSAPRKIIDIEFNNFTPSSCPSSSNKRNIVIQKKSKQILLEIEHMYIPLLKIEQTYYAIRNKMQAMPTVQQYIDELTDILIKHLHNLVAYVTIRKGKQLIHRILPHLKNPSFLWNIFFGPSICAIMLKDSEEQLLLLFLPYIRQWIFCLCLDEMNKVTECLMKNIAFVLKNVFGISVIANMIERAEEVRPITEPTVLKQWSVFLSRVISVSSETLVERPVIGLDKKIIEQHLNNLSFDQSITPAKVNNLVQRLSFLGDTSKK
ncbi:protein PAT1 homolog 1 isoform X2 [Daktulosphaira vitifoliae]|nr:protein PAT1 homolog 1 isoform X2 [Daktulosphaira vitifoliae]XP_050530291.1 protein PAT1 homolog 1 isoform X2 [Daktulosphaira vitifoliae]